MQYMQDLYREEWEEKSQKAFDYTTNNVLDLVSRASEMDEEHFVLELAKATTGFELSYWADNKINGFEEILRDTVRRTEGNDVVVTLNKKPDEDLTLEYLLQDGQTKTNVERNNIEESIDRVLPTDLSDYFFFGGERISGIANRADLSKAVRGLMRLDVLEHSRDHLQAVAKKFNGMIDTSGNAAAQKARDSLDTYKKKKAVLQENLQNAEKS